jgi:sulfotransferase family protein
MIYDKEKWKSILYRKITLNSFYKYLDKKWNKNATHVFIACLPKSGSTFLAKTLADATGFDFFQFQTIRGTHDHNIDVGLFLSNLNKDTVTQLHIKPNNLNGELFKKYKVKVVFLHRSIIDSLKSFHNHILNENNEWFMFSVAKDFNHWAIEKQFNFLIDLVVPWYINFLVSWKAEINKKEIKILDIDFEDFKNDNFTTIKEILFFYNLRLSDDKIESAIKLSYKKKKELRLTDLKLKTEYNLKDYQIDRINEYINYYPEYNIKI